MKGVRLNSSRRKPWLAILMSVVALVVGSFVLNLRAGAFSPEPPWPPETQATAIDFSKFKHDNANHARLPCLLCHRRDSNAARPVMPGSATHVPCIGCHAQEFANQGSPVCLICHTNAPAGTLKPFPRLSSFGARFDHARHMNMARVSCATCHRPMRAGVALSIPDGLGAHTTCYSCHTPGSQSNGRDISSCGTCHQLGGRTFTSPSAAAFRVGFRHAKHGRDEGLSCNECHRVQSGRRQVSAPQPLNHHASAGVFSCMSCHNGKQAFGGDDFSVCKRCHTGTAWRF
jgi:c(7)-type cytochrome triheme protein